MPDPTPERIAAALALAEAVDAAARACDAPEGTPPDLFQRTWLARCEALTAYRATLPKLRSRAEVDAEIALLTRTCVANEWAGDDDDYETWEAVTRLCREETAPAAAGNYVPLCEIDLNEETRGVPAKIGGPLPRCSSCGSEPGPSVELTFQWRGNREWYCTRGGCREPSALTDHDADTRELQDPEPCGCQLAERVARLERATEMAPYAARIRALREIRDDLEGE